MTTKVINSREAMLGGVLYRLAAPIEVSLASVYPAKVVIGDTSQDDQAIASVMSQSDWRDGIGLDQMEENSGVARAWWSTCNLRFKGNLTLPRLATITATGPAAQATILIEYQNEVYAVFGGTDVRKYDNVGDSWSASTLKTLPASVTDALVVRLAGTVYLFLAQGSDISHFDGTTWTDSTENVKYLAWWDNKIWGIDNTGQLRYRTAAGTDAWTIDAQLPLPDGSVTDLFVGQDADNNPILYAMTTVGLYAHAYYVTREVELDSSFEATKLSLPRHPDNGKGTERWRDSIFTPAGLGVYRYLDGVGTAVVTLVGPDRDDGIPADKRGVIRQLVASHNELLAVLDATDVVVTAQNMWASEQSLVMDPSLGFSSILGWDERGWQVLWLGGSQDRAITTAIVSSAYDKYRLWWGHNQRVYYMALPTDIINPNQVTDFDYALSSSHETPWFSAGQHEVSKLAIHFILNLQGMSSTETVTLSYALDLSATYTQLAVFSSNGHHHIHLPSGANHEGIEFHWIRFKLDLARGTTTTNSPKINVLTLVHRKKLEAKYGFTLKVDLRDAFGGKSEAEQRAALKKAVESKTLLEFTYRADDQNSETVRRYWVDVIAVTDVEETGLDERGVSTVTLVQL